AVEVEQAEVVVLRDGAGVAHLQLVGGRRGNDGNRGVDCVAGIVVTVAQRDATREGAADQRVGGEGVETGQEVVEYDVGGGGQADGERDTAVGGDGAGIGLVGT